MMFWFFFFIYIDAQYLTSLKHLCCMFLYVNDCSIVCVVSLSIKEFSIICDWLTFNVQGMIKNFVDGLESVL